MLIKDNIFIPSVRGFDWIIKKTSHKNFNFLKNHLIVSDIVADIILNRYPDLKDLKVLINSSLKNGIKEAYSLKDLTKSVDQIYFSLKKKNKIGILGDYDVDGFTSAALIHNYLSEIGKKTKIYIPNRLKDGYGISKKAIDFFSNNKIDLLIVLDCGSNDHEQIEYAKNKNIKIIVIDHHEIKTKAQAFSIINPKQNGDTSNLKHLSTVGLSFILVLWLHNELVEKKYLIESDVLDLRYFLDIVALGTICDLVPLKGINRIFVKKGLSVINSSGNKGLITLAKKLEINNKITVSDLGFYIGPCINAAGRVGNPELAFRLLSEKNNYLLENIASKLIENNKERKTLEDIAYNQAINLINKKNLLVENKNMYILIENEKWHPGIIGIIANKLLEKFNVPCFIISSYDKKIRGSVRSPNYIDTSKLLKKLLDTKVILSGGGHKMAGGFVITKSKIIKLKEFLSLELEKYTFCKKKKLNIDAIINISKVNKKFLEEIELLGPFGMDNLEPTLVIKNLKPIHYKIVGKKKNHVSCILEDIYGLKLKAIIFDAFENDIGENILKKNIMHIAGKIKNNEWKLEKDIQFHIDDIIVL